MAANPFLFTDDDYTSPHSATSNPFLINDDFQGEADNPFLSQSNNAPTNPFAFDPDELESTEPQVPFSTASSESFAASEHDIFGVNECTFTNANSVPQKPTDLDLKYTNTVDGNLVNDSNGPNNASMPPPRPPPSKETQDLLMSVMGAMDATSSHLLDRIPPTRTPSPVSMRDLHSPSPTPEPNLGDLLDVSDSKPVNKEPEQDQSGANDLLSLSQENVCDINQNPPLAEVPKPVKEKPARPGPPSRPPRPQPPKPPPPSFAAPVVQQSQPPPPPEQTHLPPKPPPHTAMKPKSPVDEMMDMFGSEEIAPPAPKAKATKDDILNLYNKPKAEPVVKDLLFDDALEDGVEEKAQVDTDVTMEDTFESVSKVAEPVVTEIIEQSIERVAETVAAEPAQVAQDAFLSPELQNDTQMDTSESQSKDSISSATFNPFASSEDTVIQKSPTKSVDTFHALDNNAFQDQPILLDNAPFQQQTQDITQPTQQVIITKSRFTSGDSFDAFAEKFESAKDGEVKGELDVFANGNDDTWGSNSGTAGIDSTRGFDADGSFDAFLAMQEPPAVPKSTPNKFSREGSESDEDKDFSVFIKPSVQEGDLSIGGSVPVLAPPPVTPVQAAFTDSSPRFNPFDQVNEPVAAVVEQQSALPIASAQMERTDSQETPPTPLFDEDMSQPLEPFPRTTWKGDGWEMHLRQPNKKKITGQRFWKKIFVRIVMQADCVLLQLFNQAADKDPFQELPLQPCYSVSDIGTQQYDQYGKIFTLKLQYIFYKERPGVRPGQVKKAERITNKLSQFAAYAIQGDYQGVKEFGSDLKKLGLPVEHAPQVSQLMKLGSLNYEDLKQFSVSIEEALFTLQAHRDRALHYKMEEVQITAVDELYVEQSADGAVEKQIARVRLFFLGFLTGMPDVELGVNDMRRQGKEVVGRHDIIPVVTEEWIRLEAVEFHNSVQQVEYNETHIIKFKPPDACYIELLRFRVRPPKNRELPLQLKATICVTGNKIELRADVLVPGFASRKLGQVPCEDVMIRFPIPECWIYMFRVEKHFRYGSVKSAHRRTGKIKGIERILGSMDALQESLIEVTSGQAKYEHQHRAIVWRCPRLPKEGQGAYTTHNMVCRLALTSFDQMPEKLAEYCYVEFTMPATQVSHTTVRSVSLQNTDSDDPPEKYVRYLARHEYRVGIEHTEGDSPNAYAVATAVKPAPVQEVPEPAPAAESSSDSD